MRSVRLVLTLFGSMLAPSFSATPGPLAVPLHFEPAPSSYGHFVARGTGYSIEVSPSAAWLDIQGAPIRMQFHNTNSNASAQAVNPLPGRSNYLYGNNPGAWRLGVRHYGRVRVSEIYPGVDIVYYGSGQNLEYDLVLSPGADSSRVTFSVEGAASLQLDPAGNLVIQTPKGSIVQHRPHVYQRIQGVQRDVAASYRLTASNQVRFNVGEYDHRHPLIVDPVISYGTALGGTGSNWLFGIAVDTQGNAYVAGSTNSRDFPLVSPLQSTLKSSSISWGDAFISKLDPSGTSLLYSTYFGGNSDDVATAIAVDPAGNTYVTGWTYSTDFPLTPGTVRTAAQGKHGFVVKLKPDGTLGYSALIGGNGSETGAAIAVDSAGNAYVTGGTTSTDLPTTAGAFQISRRGIGNAFVAKLNPSGTAFAYLTYLGGTNDDSANAIAIDATGNAYVAGRASSTDFPTAGAIQPSLAGGTDAFLVKLNPSGSALIYGTYLGGSDYDSASAVALDSSNNAYVAGTAASYSFPVTSGAYRIYCGQTDLGSSGFVSKINPAGSAVLYTTCTEGPADGIVVDTAGDAIVSGMKYLFYTTPDAFSSGYSEGAGFLTKLNASGSGAIYITSFDGYSSFEQRVSLAMDTAGNVYTAGSTNAVDFPFTPGSYQTKFAANINGYVIKWDLNTPAGPALTTSSPSVDFNIYADGKPVPPQTVTIDSAIPTSFTYSVSNANFQQGWLTVTSNRNTTPAILTFTVNPAGLRNYITDSAKVSIIAPSARHGAIVLPVSIEVFPVPTVTPSPSALTFGSLSAAQTPDSQTVTLVSDSKVPFTVSSNTPWLSVNPASGATPGPLTVSVSTAGLTNGSYSGVIQLSVPGASQPNQTIPVTLNIGPQLTGGGPVTLQSSLGSTADITTSAYVGTNGPPTGYKASVSGASWLSVSPSSGRAPGTLFITANASGLGLGSYTATITVSSGGTVNTLSFPVTFTVSRPSLNVYASGSNFSYQPGLPAPPPQSLSVMSNDSTIGAPFTASVTTTDGGSWIKLSASSGVTPANLSYTINPAGLALGTYTGFIKVSSAAFANSPVTIPITLSVAPFLQISSGYVQIALPRKTDTVADRVVSLSSAGTTPIDFSVTQSGGNWFTVSPTSGTTPADLTIHVNAAALAPGSYYGSVKIFSPKASQQYTYITVNLNVGTYLSLGAYNLPFSQDNAAGSPAPPPRIVPIYTGEVALPFTVQIVGNSPWLSVTPASGTTPGALSVSVNGAGLAKGVYNGTIQVTAPDAQYSPQSFGVTFTVGRTLTIDGNPFFNYQFGSSALPQPRTISLGSTGSPLGFSVSVDQPWLSATPVSGTSPATVSLSVNPAGLAPGYYNGNLKIASPDALNSMAVVPVSLSVSAPYLYLSSDDVSFSQDDPSSPAPAPKSISVSTDSVPLPFSARVATASPWLSVTPSSGVTNGTVTLSVNSSGLTKGTYSGTVYIASTVEPNNPRVIRVTFTVGRTLTFSCCSDEVDFSYQAGSRPPNPLTISIGSSGSPLSFSVSADQPWIVVTPSSGTTPATLTVTVNPPAEIGFYSGNLKISSPDAMNRETIIPVFLSDKSSPLSVSTNSLVFSQDEPSSPAPIAQFVSISTGVFAVPYTARVISGSPWLSIAPVSGVTNGTLTVSVNGSGLAKGAYSGTIRVSAPDAPSGTLYIDVSFIVGRKLMVAATNNNFYYQIGTRLAPPQVISLTSTGAALGFSITADQPWIVATPSTGTTPATISFGVDPSGLAAGSYSGNLKITSADSINPATVIPVSLFVAAAGLSISPSSVSFSQDSPSSPAPAPQSVSISTGVVSVPFTAAVSTSSPWLSVSAASGVSPGTITLSVNSSGLTTGVYYGTVQITTGPQYSSQWIQVSFTVGRALIVPRTYYSFSYQSGAGLPSGQPISITSSGSPLAFSTSTDQPWIVATPSSGTTPATVSLSVNPAGLAPGYHSGYLRIAAPDSVTAAIQISVTFYVYPASPVTATPESIAFTAIAGSSNSQTQVVTLSSASPYSFTVTTGCCWLGVSARTGIAPSTLSITAYPGGLRPGIYNLTVYITGPDLSSRAIPVSLTIVDRAAYSAEPSALVFQASTTGVSPPTQKIQVSSSNLGAQFSAKTSVTWLSVNPANGSTPGAVTVSVNATGLAAGQYSGEVIIYSPGGNGDNATVVVTLTVTDPAQLLPTPASLEFTAVSGGVSPDPQTLYLTSRGKQVDFIASTNAPWLIVAPTQGQTPVNLQVSAYTVNLAPGVYNATITLSSPQISTSPTIIPVKLTVATAP